MLRNYPFFSLSLHQTQLKKLFSTLWIFAIGIFCLILFHRLEIFSGLSQITGDKGDTRLIVFNYEHLWQVIQGKAELLSPGIFYPQKGALGFTDSLIGFEPIYALFRAMGAHPFRATLLNLLAWDIATYLSATVLILRVFKTEALPAAIGGALFTFSSVKLNQMNHLQLQPLTFLPLILIFLHSVYQNHRTLTERAIFLRLSMAAFLLTLQLISAYYFGWFLIFWISLLLIVIGTQISFKELIQNLTGFGRNHIKAVAGAILVLCIGLSLFLRIYLPVALEFGMRGFSDAFSMTPEFKSLFWMGPQNWIWGWLPKVTSFIKEIPNESEQRVGVGLTLLTFWIICTNSAFRIVRKKPISQSWNNLFNSTNPILITSIILSVNLFIFFGFKYSDKISLWVFPFHLFPGARAVRAVARYFILLMLPIAGLFSAWLNQCKSQSRWVWILALFALLEQQGSFPGFNFNDDWARLHKISQEIPSECSSFFMRAHPSDPAEEYEIQLDAMLISLMRGIPTVNGYSGMNPSAWKIQSKNPNSLTQVADWFEYKKLRPWIKHKPCEIWFNQ